MIGKIIVIEGIDGSGKNTQTNHILNYLNNSGIKASKISFPAYKEETSHSVVRWVII